MPKVQTPFNGPCAHRKVFFTDYGQIPKVERCDMDGQNRTKLVDSKIVFPHGITLDLVNRLVYWADAYLDYIEVVDYEGKGRQTIIQGILVREKPSQGSHSLGLPVRGGHCGAWLHPALWWGGVAQALQERRGHGSCSDGNSHFRDVFYFPFIT